jgi:hypothetical protein
MACQVRGLVRNRMSLVSRLYAAPPGPYQAPPPKKSRAGAIVVAVIVIVALVVLLFYAGVFRPTVTITGVNWTIQYNGVSSGYFGPSPQSVCSACPITQIASTTFTYTITLTSTALFLTHTIDTVTVDPPFTFVSVSPSLPISVTSGGSATLTLTIQVPSDGGSYVMAGTIATT